jgi:glyoxylase-like metal-dependent hydrolase (beta-lactamase superfamily II)
MLEILSYSREIMRPMPISEITYEFVDLRVRIFRAGSEVDCFAIITSSHVVILDTFTTPEDALEMMEILKPSLEHRMLLVINSHQHSDHTWGNAVFAQDGEFPAPILAHKNSRNFLEQQKTQLLEQQKLEPRLMSVKIVVPTVYFSDSCTINAGDLTLELIPAFGHTSDQIVVWIPEMETLLATDALEFPFPYVASSGNLTQMLDTMHKLQALKPRVVLPCHGGLHDSSLITKNLEYFDWLKARVLEEEEAAIEDALKLLDLKPSDVDEMYLEFHGLNITATKKFLKDQSSY